MQKVIKLSEFFPFPYSNICSNDNRSRYNGVAGSRGSLKSTIVGANNLVFKMETDRFTSAIIIVKNKNKHYTTTYKAIRNAFRKFGTFDN